MAKPIELSEPMTPEEFEEFVRVVTENEDKPLSAEVLALVAAAKPSVDKFLSGMNK